MKVYKWKNGEYHTYQEEITKRGVEMSAIEVLKKFRYTDENVSINQLHKALDVALLALQSQTEFELLQKRNAFLQEQKEDNRKQGALKELEKLLGRLKIGGFIDKEHLWEMIENRIKELEVSK